MKKPLSLLGGFFVPKHLCAKRLHTRALPLHRQNERRCKLMYYDDDEYYSRDKYAGSYAHDVEGFSDDDIDAAFEGDPEAYWNID